MVARKMATSSQSVIAKSHPSSSPRHSRVDRFLLLQLAKLQLRRRISAPQILIPRMDLYQDDNLPSTYALFELPGIGEESLRVDVQNDKLTVEGARGPPLRTRLNDTLRSRAKAANAQFIPEFTLSDEKYLGRELNFGYFRRQVELPAGTKASDVRHELRDGMLLVTWPRQPKQPSLSMVTGGTTIPAQPPINTADTRNVISV